MKIIVLDGSHKKTGMTLKLVSRFIDGIKSIKPETEIKSFDLLDSKIAFCLGCGKCVKDKDPLNAKCSLSDDVDEIKKEALEADILVFASPIYEYCVSSAMKRFLERCLTLVTFKFGPVARAKAIKGKYGVIICSSGAPFPFNYLMGITRYPKFILKLACRLFRCEKIKILMAGGMEINDRFKKKEENKAYALGIKIGGIR